MNRSHLNWPGLKFILALALCLSGVHTAVADIVPLAGTWRFALDRADAGTNENWFSKDLPDKIQLPGILEAQGYGDEIGIHTPWVLSLYDHFWYLRNGYAAYTNSDNVKVPFLCQPPRHYLGAAWYQRDIEVPADWSGQRVTLFLERPHWRSIVWLDDHEIGTDLSLCTPHEYVLGSVTPGKHRLTIRVDNRMQLPYRPDAHSVSDSLDDAWNGIVGKIELRSTPPVWVDHVRIFPDLKDRKIIVQKTFNRVSGRDVTVKISYNIDSAFGAPDPGSLPSSENLIANETSGETTQIFDLGSNAIPWGESSPTLYRLHINVRSEIDGSVFEQKLTNVFGLRDLHTEGSQFILNGQPIYFRGTHFGGDFPLTGYPPTDVESWKKIFQTCKDYGLNQMRFHSWCPPEAAFTAADELGFYLQVECGMWNTFDPGSEITKQLYRETDRILECYGNHPSLMLLSASNEPKGHWQNVLPEWAAHYRAADPRRLYTTGTGFTDRDSPGPIDRVDYTVTGRFGPARVRGETGWFGNDYRQALEGVNIPVISHELGQWVAYPDYDDVIKKFTGFMRPGNFEIFRDSAAAHGMLAQDKEFALASGRFQLACYKEEIEANLRTPGLSGFELLDLHDYTGQGTALVGLLDPFWESKGYVTPEEFREFCGPVVPLARLRQRVFTTADLLNAPVEVANFGTTAITNGQMTWAICDTSGKRLVEDSAAPVNIPIGKNIPLGKITADLSKLPAPAQYQLLITVGPQPVKSWGKLPSCYQNEWNFWLYPAANDAATLPDVLVTGSWDDAAKNLADGGKVLFQPPLADLDWRSPPLARTPVFWNALMGPTWSRMLGLWCDTNHPALAEFPTEPNCDWQWTTLVGNCRAVNLEKLPPDLTPIVSAIDDWNRNYKLGVIFEASVGNGKLVFCTIALDDRPAAKQLRQSLLSYMESDWFQPKASISADNFLALHFDTRIMHRLGATATADGAPARELVDGDPNTYWASADARGQSTPHPHTIIVRFKNAVSMRGLILMPRQNHREHQGDINEYRLESSDDGTNWQQICTGNLPSTFDPIPIPFASTITASQLRLTDISGFGSDDSASLAEIAVDYAGPKLAEDSGKVEYKQIRTASPDIDAGETKPAGH